MREPDYHFLHIHPLSFFPPTNEEEKEDMVTQQSREEEF